MITQLASGINGRNQLNDLNAQQQELANKILTNRMQGIQGMFAPVPTGNKALDIPSPMLTPEMQDQIAGAGGSLTDAHTAMLPTARQPTMQESMTRGFGNSDPQVQAISSAILNHLGTMSEKNMFTSGDQAAAGRFWTAPSILAAMGRDAFNNPIITDPSKLQHVPEVKTAGPTDRVIAVNQDNPDASKIVGAPEGAVGAPIPAQQNQAELLKQQLSPEGPLESSRMTVQKANAVLPLLGDMMDLVANGVNSGNLAKARQEVGQIAAMLGAKVDVNKIVDTQTLAAYGMPVTSALVHAITSRATGQELQMIGQSVGSDMSMTAPAMAKALNQQVATLLNTMVEHRGTVEAAQGVNPLFTPAMAAAYLRNSDPEAALGSVGAKRGSLAVKQMPNKMFAADNAALDEAIKYNPETMGATNKALPIYEAVSQDGTKIYSVDGKSWRHEDGTRVE
jgi:hypothetical protein